MSTTRVELPPGCAGLDLPDGSILRPKELGGSVEVPDRYAQQAARALGKAPASLGFAGARMGPATAICGSCGFNRFCWADRPDVCPRCGRHEHLEVA
jgi:hypothetical protein